MTLSHIHAAMVTEERGSSLFIGAALDCILLANEWGPGDLLTDAAHTQAMIYAQLATAAATVEASNAVAKSNYDGRI